MKQAIESLAQVIGFDLAGLVTNQFRHKYETKKYAGCICDDYFTYINKRDALFSRYVSRHFSAEKINHNIIPPLTNQAFETFDDEWENQRRRW